MALASPVALDSAAVSTAAVGDSITTTTTTIGHLNTRGAPDNDNPRYWNDINYCRAVKNALYDEYFISG